MNQLENKENEHKKIRKGRKRAPKSSKKKFRTMMHKEETFLRKEITWKIGSIKRVRMIRRAMC